MKENIKKYINKLKDAKQSEDKDLYDDLLSELEKSITIIIKEQIHSGEGLDLVDTIDEMVKEIYKEKILSEDEIGIIKNNLGTVLSIYSNLMPLEKLGESGTTFIQECTQRIVIYNDANFINEYNKYGFNSKEEMEDLCYAIKNIYFSHIINRLPPVAAEKQVKDLFDFSPVLANMYKTLYELNYDKLTMNVIMFKIKEVR